tara:strand:- start:7 stop:924 length:918 start_codon:yes stop_codon:yes gene_type:complete
MKKRRYAGYVRELFNDNNNADAQISVIKEYCKKQSIRAHFYIDDDTNGENNENLIQLQDDAIKGKIGTIIVSNLSSLSPKASEGMMMVDEWLDKDISVVSVKEDIRFDRTNGKLAIKILKILTKWNKSSRRERAIKSIKLAKEKNPEKFKGRKTGAYAVDGEKILELRSKKMSLAKIAQTLMIGKTTVQNHIERKAALDVESALSLMVKKNNLSGSFKLNFDFKNGLNGAFTANSMTEIKIPKFALSILMKASKKWYSLYFDKDKDLYWELMTKIAFLWYDHDSFEDLNNVNPINLIKEAEVQIN